MSCCPKKRLCYTPADMRMKNRLRSTKAFTLLELAVVIVIITLLTSGGVAMLMSAMSRKSYSDTQEEINYIQQIIGDYFFAHRVHSLPGRHHQRGRNRRIW